MLTKRCFQLEFRLVPSYWCQSFWPPCSFANDDNDWTINRALRMRDANHVTFEPGSVTVFTRFLAILTLSCPRTLRRTSRRRTTTWITKVQASWAGKTHCRSSRHITATRATKQCLLSERSLSETRLCLSDPNESHSKRRTSIAACFHSHVIRFYEMKNCVNFL